ncbi:MAG: ClpX C4-type zinc finger protein [Acidobacteriota bacterium]
MTDRTLSLGLSGSSNESPSANDASGSTQVNPEEASAPRTEPARCSFCGLGEGEVERLFQGRAGYICGECVDVCLELLADYRELGIAPPESKRSWYQRWFAENIDVACSFTPHDEESPQGERLFPGPGVQICEQCVRACAVLKSGNEIYAGA